MRFSNRLLSSTALIFSALVCVLSLVGCSISSKESCEQNVIAFDFGSGSIKSKGALVDVCQGQVLAVFHESQTKSNFKEDIQASGDSASISEASLNNAVGFVQKTMVENSTRGVLHTKAAGTAALREASNAQDLVARIRSSANIDLKIITQDEEAKLAFFAVKSRAEYKDQKLTVWDIGGGSQQVITETTDGLMVFKSRLASVSFKDEVIREVKKQNPKEVRSPNPMTRTQLNQALKLAEQKAQDFKTSEKVIVHEKVIGVGGVLSRSLPDQLNSHEPTKARLEAILSSRPGKTDKDIGGQFAETDTTNLILTLGHMKAFGIDKFKAEKINLTDGLLISPNY